MWLGGSFLHPFHLNMCCVSKSNKLSSHLVKALVGSKPQGTFQGTDVPSSTLISYAIDHLSALTLRSLVPRVERNARPNSQKLNGQVEGHSLTLNNLKVSQAQTDKGTQR